MSQSADETWEEYEALFIDNDMGDVRRGMRLQREATEATAREIAREVVADTSAIATRNLLERVKRLEARVQHLYDVRDEDLQAEQEREERTDWGVKPSELCDECRELALSRAKQEIAHNRKGGDADAHAAGPVPAPDDSPDVATGAGAKSEQDAPAPQRYRIDENGRDEIRFWLQFWGVGAPQDRANNLADRLEPHIVPEPGSAPSEGEDGDPTPEVTYPRASVEVFPDRVVIHPWDIPDSGSGEIVVPRAAPDSEDDPR